MPRNKMDDFSLEELEELYSNVDGLELDNELQEELINKIAIIIVTYLVVQEYMKMTNKEKVNAKTDIKITIETSLNKSLEDRKNTINNVLKNLNWSNSKELTKVINEKIDNKTWLDRLIKNKSDTGKKLMKTVKDFLNGDISINDIKDKLTKIIRYDLYKDKRLFENEIARVTNTLKINNYKRMGIKKVRRCAVLDARTCDVCASEDGTVYFINEAPNLPEHIRCRCYWEKVD